MIAEAMENVMLYALAVVLALVVIAPLLMERRLLKVDDAARQAATGELAQLSQGVTHYRWIGPVRGPVLVAIHGLATPLQVWDGIAPGLARLGYRVLVYDLYGRGLSDAPGGIQDRAFHLRQLNDLLDDQGLGDELTVVGFSMGGAIATAFAAENPHRMKRLILLASAGFVANESGFSMFCRRVPVLGDWLHGVVGTMRMRAALPGHDAAPAVAEMADVQRNELLRRGFMRAILASRRGILSEQQEADHRKISHDDVPVVAVWGDADRVVPISALGVLAQWNRAARQEVVKGADHAMPYSHAPEVLALLTDIMRETVER